MPARIEIVSGDITAMDVDAVVNAANEGLHGGEGVDGAIHRAAGPELLEACRAIGRCPTGGAVITPGFESAVRYVIHAVGPVWRGGERDEHALLASGYTRSLELAAAHDVRSIAFPAISCGAYGFPVDRAAQVAVDAVRSFCRSREDAPAEVYLVCFEPEVQRAYERYAGG